MVNDSNSDNAATPSSLNPPPLPIPNSIAHSKLRYQYQLLQFANTSTHPEQVASPSKTERSGVKTAALSKLLNSIDGIFSNLRNEIDTLAVHVASTSAVLSESEKQFFQDYWERQFEICRKIQRLYSDLANLETKMGKSSSLSNSPWKQNRCQCKEEIDKEVVSLMEAECSCMICEEIFVDATVTSCGHTFCNLCVKKWYCTSPKKDCPMCRQPLAIGTVKRNVEVDSFVTRLHLRLSDKIKRTRNSLLKTRRSNVIKFDAKLPNCNSVILPAASITSADEEDFRRIRTHIRKELSSSFDHDAQIATVTLDLDKVDASVQTDNPPSPFDSLSSDSSSASTLEELYQVLESEPSTRFDPGPSYSLGPTAHGQSQDGKEGNEDEEVLILPTPPKIPKVLDFIDITDDHSEERSRPSTARARVPSTIQNHVDDPIVQEPVPSTSSSAACNLNSPPCRSSTVDLSALEDNIITPSIASRAVSALGLGQSLVALSDPPSIVSLTPTTSLSSALTLTPHVPIRLGIKRDSNGKLRVFQRERSESRVREQ